MLLLNIGVARAQTSATAENPYYARKNTFSLFSAYSGDSSHMILGIAENRMLLEFGAGYSRRLLHNRIVNWQYNGEILPVALESDPNSHVVQVQTSPTSAIYTYDTWPDIYCATVTTPYSQTIDKVTYSGTYTDSCHGRQ